VGTLLLPGLAALLLLGVPYLRRWTGFGAICALLFGALVLGLLAVRQDARDPRLLAAQRRDAADAELARKLATSGVPPEGPRALMEADPLYRGHKVFVARCAQCHDPGPNEVRNGPDLNGYLSEPWLVDLLRSPDEDRFFGKTKAKGQMEGYGELGNEKLRALAAFLRNQRTGSADPEGAKLFSASGCESCHALGTDETNIGPNLGGYGSPKWLVAFLDAPGSDLFYGEANEMPKFQTKLSAEDKQAVINYLGSLLSVPAPTAP
jgi:mono/diheme cytochrome c family protein